MAVRWPSMRVRIGLVVLALVAIPATVFAVGKSHPNHDFARPGAAYVTPALTASEKSIRSQVVEWVRRHPDAGCQVQNDTAICSGGTDMVLLVAGNQSP